MRGRFRLGGGARISFHNAVLCAISFFLFVGGFVTPPGEVVCFGPHHHYHFEMPLIASCERSSGQKPPVAPRPRDGCPQGSRDIRLTASAQRIDAKRGSAIAQTLNELRYTVAGNLPSEANIPAWEPPEYGIRPAQLTAILIC